MRYMILILTILAGCSAEPEVGKSISELDCKQDEIILWDDDKNLWNCVPAEGYHTVVPE